MEYPEEWNELPKRERKKKIRALKAQDVSKSSLIGRIRNWSIDLIIAVLLIGGIYYWSTNREILPPTDMAGHIEQNPSSHVMDEPMSLSVQKHMLEHSDGKGPPGVIINYNCEDFECEPGLKEKLAEIANKYSEFVYVAPFSNMSKKIAITRMGKIQTFDNLDKNALVQFIEGK
ncbi:hypothetical protein A3A76_01250 [Candidatus Woesebacteria bacterium RIFCSPLOWO2_01_FULL_39_23]|uniref:Uncharacterized protein n=1 Tax=Candidatus Woesebacteria bacterium RIFCSPHIGHO2_01_FULL_40_22 TaxID=1802499 RepID=A0A1F7YGL3_9BACT|nr:MAG: hypothetical protein A2141_05120 [Candidatus Woesebacteria bacterium RBG_16_40_11]OGM26453.1 MAG: hypothetical protein A2628_02845 [Candidatus Woesebacteria bacterium RIFCSPHIGHO2_01_FULL_40_22]OGM37622.1 MAG: hypothetical protein A3E41_05360 [Candidatus Woesebacteria bacterium RIFCSPHIGHO2_12_FULL_38_9]OGM62906.1 MAG: hypothetical protein A3A76_01250 [Candidatus Woesebacteria bacterium RIFCSPLOWO2_01_FULL_39_23]